MKIKEEFYLPADFLALVNEIAGSPLFQEINLGALVL